MIKPTGKYVLLKVNKQENNSSIYIPKQYLKKERKGTVLAIKDDVYVLILKLAVKGEWTEKKVEPGDVVTFTTSGAKDTEDGILIHCRNLIGILETKLK
jgi:co-chaperonin GroES (HSP10)